MSELLKEHYGYLSDGIRQQRFQEALSQVVRPGDSVADIGSGFGILGLLCLKAGASRVWGIDRTDAIEIARETMRRAGLEHRYICVREDSRRATLPQKVDIVICDHVGNFGFDYHIVATLADARRRLLKPGGKVLPQQVTMQTAGVSSEALRSLAEGWRREPILPEFHWLHDYGSNSKHHYNFAKDEVVTSQADLGTIDLRTDSPEHRSFSAQLGIGRDGQLDGLGGWFACEIADGVWMTNSPLAADQINRCQVFLPFAEPLAVVAGDVVEVTVSVHHETALMAWTARVERTGQTARQSTWKSTILQPEDKVPAAERIPRLNEVGAARKTLLAQIDGTASNADIERAVLKAHPMLFPSADEIARFVRTELLRSSA